MNKKEIDKFGIYILIINVIIILFMITSKNALISYYIVSIISNIIAIVFNSMIIKECKKKKINIITLIINLLVLIILIGYTLIKFNII